MPPPPRRESRNACRPPRHDRASSGEEPTHHRAATGADRAETRRRPPDNAFGKGARDVRTDPCRLRTEPAVDRDGAGDERVALLKARRGPGASPSPIAAPWRRVQFDANTAIPGKHRTEPVVISECNRAARN